MRITITPEANLAEAIKVAKTTKAKDKTIETQLPALRVKNFFPDFIGQKEVILYLNKLLTIITSDRSFPIQPMFFNGHAGLGKTRMAKKIANVLEEYGWEFVVIPTSCNLPSFVQLYCDRIQGRKVIVFVDECHQIIKNAKVRVLLQEILETENEVADITLESGAAITADPYSAMWIFASNEEPKCSALFGPAGRTKELTFTNYSREESKKIILQKAKKHSFEIEEDALEMGVDRVIPNGRAIKEFVEDDLYSYSIITGGKITASLMEQVIIETRRYPLGIREIDMVTLNGLAREPRGMQVGEIGAMCNGENAQKCSERLQILTAMGMIITGSNGRKTLAQGGIQYLADYKAMQEAAKEARKAAKAAGKEYKPTVAKVRRKAALAIEPKDKDKAALALNPPAQETEAKG